jgi:hypothetical protein
MRLRAKLPANDSERLGRLPQRKGKLSMRQMRSFGLALTVVGALGALSACETPTREQFNTLQNRVASLESQVSAAQTRANDAAASAGQCQQVCERADRMFQQGVRK